jgi:hypothetical protein
MDWSAATRGPRNWHEQLQLEVQFKKPLQKIFRFNGKNFAVVIASLALVLLHSALKPLRPWTAVL